MPEKMKPVLWYLDALGKWIRSFGHKVVLQEGIVPDLWVCNIQTTEQIIVRMVGRKFYATSPGVWGFTIEKAEKPIEDELFSFSYVFAIGPRQVESINGSHVYHDADLEKDDVHHLGQIICEATNYDVATARDRQTGERYLIVVLPPPNSEVEIRIRNEKFVATRMIPGLGDFFHDFGSKVAPFRYQILI